MSTDINPKLALIYGDHGPVTDPGAPPPPQDPAPPPPAPPPDKFDPPAPSQGAAPPPTVLPTGTGEPESPYEHVRRLVDDAAHTGNTDELARYLRELRRQNWDLSANISSQLFFNYLNVHYPPSVIGTDRYLAIKGILGDLSQCPYPPSHA